MQQNMDVFLNVMKTAFWKVPLDFPVGFKDWKYILKISKAQALVGHVADVMLTTPEVASGLSPVAKEKLQDMTMATMAMHATSNNTLILVVNTLREHGVEPVLLKGQGLASYYPVPQLRSCGDIDIYVGPENYETAYDALAPIATQIDPKETISGGGKHFHMFIGKTALEIHRYTEILRSPSKNRIYQEFANDGLRRNLVPVELPLVTLNTPADTYNIYYVFSHFFNHVLGSGVVLRQLFDLACLLHSRAGKFDMEKLCEVLKQTDLLAPWQVIGCAMVDVLGMPESEFPFYNPSMRNRGGKLVDFILSEEYFIRGNPLTREYKRNYLYEKFFSLRCEFRRLFRLFPIFPCNVLERMLHTLVGGTTNIFKELNRKRKAAKR